MHAMRHHAHILEYSVLHNTTPEGPVIGQLDGRDFSEFVLDEFGRRFAYSGVAPRLTNGQFDDAALKDGEFIVPQMPTLGDLAIFYYGYAVLNEKGISRKLQIKTKMSPEEQKARGAEHPNMVTQERFLTNIERFHRPRCSDLSGVVSRVARHQYPAEAPVLETSAA